MDLPYKWGQLTVGCGSAAEPAEPVGGRASYGTGPSRRASQDETLGCCHIPGGPSPVLVGSCGWMEACLVSA